MKLKIPTMEDPELNVAPLIDMVFLLIVYFLVSASLIRSEADLGIRLPGMLAPDQVVEMVDEQTIIVNADGRVLLNDREYDSPMSRDLPELVHTLIRYKQASDATGNEPLVTIWADDEAFQQRVVDVMNACAQAQIGNVTFSASLD